MENENLHRIIFIISYVIAVLLITWGIFAIVGGRRDYLDEKNRADELNELYRTAEERYRNLAKSYSTIFWYTCEVEKIGNGLRNENQQLRKDNKRFEDKFRGAVGELRATNRQLAELQQRNEETIGRCQETIDRMGERNREMERLLQQIIEGNQEKKNNSVP